MSDTNTFNPSGIESFPELYQKNLQDEINDYYNHDKVLPRVEGKDYINKGEKY